MKAGMLLLSEADASERRPFLGFTYLGLFENRRAQP